MENKDKGRFTVIEPTEADKEAIRTGKVMLDPTNFPKEVIGPAIINTEALQNKSGKLTTEGNK